MGRVLAGVEKAARVLNSVCIPGGFMDLMTQGFYSPKALAMSSPISRLNRAGFSIFPPSLTRARS